MTTTINSQSALWDDLHAAERFPFAAAAKRCSTEFGRKQLAEFTHNNERCGHEVLRSVSK